MSPSTHPTKDSKRGIIGECLPRFSRRRKVFQPKKSSHGQQISLRRRGRSRRSLPHPPNSEGESEDEDKAEKLEEECDEDTESLERIGPESYDEINVFKGKLLLWFTC